MDWLLILGFSAGILPMTSFIFQAVQTIKTKDTKSISLPMYILFCSGVFLWIVYGILKSDVPIIFANTPVFILSTIILICKLKYK